jgi:flagellar hook-associated protein 1 FlgK
MGLSGLDSALSGLKTYQKQIEVISTNVANVGTEGYTRKILPQTTQAVQGETVGVVQETIVRNVDIRLSRDLWTQVSAVGFYDIQQTYLNRIDQFHGDPAAEISVASEISRLQDSFSALAHAPEDAFLLADTVDQAQDTVRKINDLSDYISTLRNDAQSEATSVVQSINDLLEQVAGLNSQIRFSTVSGQTTAALDDKRDTAIKELSSLMEISFFTRGDGVLVVQTSQGIELAADLASPLTFSSTPLSTSSFYPSSAAGVFVGDPTQDTTAVDITQRNIGGKLGGLLEIRDQIFPKQLAQLDELAHKMARRFEAQGLRLFTDASGSVPANTAPNSTTNTPVPYVGFAGEIEVNASVLNDHSLIQKGTYGGNTLPGSSEVISRVIEHAFGTVDYKMAANSTTATSVDIRANATGTTTLQEWLGLRSSNTVTSGISLNSYASIAAMVAAGGATVFGSGASGTDTFTLRFDDPDIGGGPYDVDIDLSTVATSGSGAAQDLINHITADGDWANIVADFSASVTVDTNGALVINSRSNIEIAAGATQPLSETGYAFVGFQKEVVTAQDPYFDVVVGTNDPVRVSIAPTDTETNLLAKLNAISGLAAQVDASGFLSLRPGESFSTPDYGGEIKIIAGPTQTSAATLAGTASGRTSINDGVSITSALFGTYQNLGGGVYEDQSPLVDVLYQSETDNSSGSYVLFREDYLGPNADISTEITGATSLDDFARKIINQNSLELLLLRERKDDEQTLQILLEQKILDDSAVNLDEELGYLIVVQTAYAASARVINAVDEIFEELLRVI